MTEKKQPQISLLLQMTEPKMLHLFFFFSYPESVARLHFNGLKCHIFASKVSCTVASTIFGGIDLGLIWLTSSLQNQTFWHPIKCHPKLNIQVCEDEKENKFAMISSPLVILHILHNDKPHVERLEGETVHTCWPITVNSRRGFAMRGKVNHIFIQILT